VLAKDWGFGNGIRYFSFFGAVQAPEEKFEEESLRRLLLRRRTLWEDSDDGICARAVRGPRPGTAVLAVWSVNGGWEEIGVVSWPLRFVAPGGYAGGPKYGVRRGGWCNELG
jgi:hypothetical protein